MKLFIASMGTASMVCSIAAVAVSPLFFLPAGIALMGLGFESIRMAYTAADDIAGSK